jgi:hypothetical protein
MKLKSQFDRQKERLHNVNKELIKKLASPNTSARKLLRSSEGHTNAD